MKAAPEVSAERTEIVDALRGWALLGVVLVNFSIFYNVGTTMRIPADETTSRVAKILMQVLFQSKGWTMLAFLFGYGFSVLIARLGCHPHPILAYSRRMFWLFIIAIVNCALYFGDVLKDYVLVGMIVVMFHRVSARMAGFIALACLLAFPALIPWSRELEFSNPIVAPELALYRSHDLPDVLNYGLLSGLRMSLSFSKYFDWNLVMLSCAFAGVACQRSGMLENLHSRRGEIRLWCFGGLVFALVSAGANAVAAASGIDLRAHYDIGLWPMLGQMVSFMAALCWLHVAGRMLRVFDSLRIVGRMTLTNYMIQNVLGLLIFSGFGLGLLHRLPFWAHLALALLVFALQIVFSRAWLATHTAGPVERLWRRLSTMARHR
jgi:uncharacterized protein